jgi:hypothetical protein
MFLPLFSLRRSFFFLDFSLSFCLDFLLSFLFLLFHHCFSLSLFQSSFFLASVFLSVFMYLFFLASFLFSVFIFPFYSLAFVIPPFFFPLSFFLPSFLLSSRQRNLTPLNSWPPRGRFQQQFMTIISTLLSGWV